MNKLTWKAVPDDRAPPPTVHWHRHRTSELQFAQPCHNCKRMLPKDAVVIGGVEHTETQYTESSRFVCLCICTACGYACDAHVDGRCLFAAPAQEVAA